LRPRSVERAAAAAAGALLFATLFFSGGSSGDRIVWIGGAVIVLAAVGLVAACAGMLPLPRLDATAAAFVVALAALTAWAGTSLAWSIVPDRSWIGFNRTLVYVAFAVLGLLLGTLLRRAPTMVAAGLTVLLAAVVGWALLGKIFPALYAEPPASPITRLRNPIGYWNALALLADAAMPLALWIAAPLRRPHALRVTGVVLLYAAIVAVLLTYSRTGVVVGVAAVAAWIVLIRDRLASLAAVAVAAPVALAVSLFAFTRSGLEHFQPYSARVHDGAWFGVVLVAGAALVASIALAASRREERRPETPERRRVLERRAAVVLGVAVATAVVGLAFRAGGPAEWWREFTNPADVTQSSSRFGRASSHRWTWWDEAWRLFEKKPVQGWGASSFAVARKPVRQNPLEVTEPHNTALQFLSELGLVGFALAGAATLAALAAAVASIRRAGPDRSAAAALTLGLGVYLVHALVDYDWEFLAVTGPVLLVAGVLAAAGRRAVVMARRPLLPAAAAVAAALGALYSLGAPWLAERRVDEAYAAIDRQDIPEAVAKARSARRLNPLSYEPYWAMAGAALAVGDDRAALLAYEKAAVLQPENAETWYALGEYLFETGRFARACYALDLAYRLDPRGPAGEPGGLLDQVKKKLPGCPGPSGR
jgi:hypothetical protein